MEEDKNKLSTEHPVPKVVVETYAADMAGALQDGKNGIIKKIIHGEEEHELEKMERSPESMKNRILMSLSALFVLLSVLALGVSFIKKQVPTVPVAEQFVPLIYTDKSAVIETATLTKDELAVKVRAEMQKTILKPQGIEGIYLTANKNPLGFREFIKSIDSNAIFVDDTTIVSDNFLLGFFKEPSVMNGTEKENLSDKDFFILIKMRSITDVFTSLHEWENKMFFDLHGFFGIDFTADTKYLLTKNFEDGIVENKNARILYDKDNKPVMMYVFADDNSVVITNNHNAVREIILRLASSEVKK